MTVEFSWIPGTIMLAVGLLVGGLVIWRLMKKTPAKAAPRGRAGRDLELRIADHEARRDELYTQLRAAEELSAAERREFELAAARALRDLDLARVALREVDPKSPLLKKVRTKKKATTRDEAGAEREAAPAGPVRRPVALHPFAVFVYGVSMTSLVFLLIFWAQDDATPDPMAQQGTAQGADGVPADHPELGEGDPQLQAQIESLEAQLAANPDDLPARKQLAVLLAASNQLLEAYQQSEQILGMDPDDPDALYIIAAVRLSMGQSEMAVEFIDRVLAQYPDHVMAHLVRGMALARLGDLEEAIASWERGIEADGGSNPELEQLIAQARSELGGVPPEGDKREISAPPVPPKAAAPPEEDDGQPRVYQVYIELAPGATVPPGASLFVSVHDPNGGGGPSAVKRVADPEFPVELSLTESDSMTGIPLPAMGVVVIQLDSDGNPGTQSPSDLMAQGRGRSGRVTKFVLR